MEDDMTRKKLTKKELKTIESIDNKLLKIFRKYECDSNDWSETFCAQIRGVDTLRRIISDIKCAEGLQSCRTSLNKGYRL